MDNWHRLSRLPFKELREIQNQKLHHFISRQLYPFSPYYHKLFDRHNIKPGYIKTVEDLRIIPFTKKEDFLPNPQNPQVFRDFILQPDEKLIKKYWPKTKLIALALTKITKGSDYLKKSLEKEYKPVFLTATTGTTQTPVSFLYSDYDLRNLSRSGYRLLEVFGGKRDTRAVNIFPYAPHLAFWQTFYAAVEHNDFMLSTGGGKVMGTQGNIEAICKVKPNFLIGVPGYLYHLIRAGREQGKDFSFLEKIVLGASAVPPGFKEKLAQILSGMGVKRLAVMGTYGFTEAKCAWGECPTEIGVSSGYHTYPDMEIFEVIDPESGEARKEGEDGELVYTALDGRGSAVVRYRTGDLVKGGITYQPCPYCKRTLPRINSQIYRASNIKDLKLSKLKGTLVNLSDFGEILEGEKGVEEWQIEVRKKDNDPYEIDELVVYLSLAPAVESQSLKARLREKMLSATEVSPNEIIILEHKAMLEQVEMELAHKVKRFVDKRPKI